MLTMILGALVHSSRKLFYQKPPSPYCAASKSAGDKKTFLLFSILKELYAHLPSAMCVLEQHITTYTVLWWRFLTQNRLDFGQKYMPK